MKKAILIALMALGVNVLSAQHTATLTGRANFKTQPDGMVKVEFTLDKELSTNEINELFNWMNDNDGVAVVQVNVLEVSVSLVAEIANRDAYSKAFMFMGIDTWIVNENGQVLTLDTEGLFRKFNM